LRYLTEPVHCGPEQCVGEVDRLHEILLSHGPEVLRRAMAEGVKVEVFSAAYVEGSRRLWLPTRPSTCLVIDEVGFLTYAQDAAYVLYIASSVIAHVERIRFHVRMKPLTIADAATMVLRLQDGIRRSEEGRYDCHLHGALLVAQGMTCPEFGRLLGTPQVRQSTGSGISKTEDRPVWLKERDPDDRSAWARRTSKRCKRRCEARRARWAQPERRGTGRPFGFGSPGAAVFGWA
jgi:hypothetical protein